MFIDVMIINNKIINKLHYHGYHCDILVINQKILYTLNFDHNYYLLFYSTHTTVSVKLKNFTFVSTEIRKNLRKILQA